MSGALLSRVTRALALAALVSAGLTAGGQAAEGPAMAPAVIKPAPSASPSVPLADHRATYRITLLKSTGAKSPTFARGRVSYEFTGSVCDGYSQVFRQVTELQPAEGATRLSDMRSATFEDADQKGFSFDVKTSTDESPPETVDGRASRKKDVLAIQLSKPTVQTVDVGDDVLFPTAHLQHIIAAARAGQHVFGVKVFDGSDNGKKVYDTTTVIGRPLLGPVEQGDIRDPTMDAMSRWPVSISYFDEGRKDGEPAYTLGFELYENGVSRALRFDYGDFVLAGEVTSLDLLPMKPCK